MKPVNYVLLILMSKFAVGQFDPQFSQYMFNGLVVNPAVAGSKEEISTNLFYKRLFRGVGILPIVKSFNIHAPLYNNKIGVGFQINEEKFGIEHRMSSTFTYAYKINFARGIFSFGISAGIVQSTVKYSELLIMESERANFADLNTVLPDIGFGVYYNNTNFYIGISAIHLFPNKLNISNRKYDFDILARHYYLMTGYKIDLSEKIAILPTAFIKYVDLNRFVADATVHLKYNDFIWAGISARSNEMFSIQTGLKISELIKLTRQSIKVGYAYDWPANALQKASFVSNELFLTIGLNIYESPSKIRKSKINVSPILF